MTGILFNRIQFLVDDCSWIIRVLRFFMHLSRSSVAGPVVSLSEPPPRLPVFKYLMKMK